MRPPRSPGPVSRVLSVARPATRVKGVSASTYRERVLEEVFQEMVTSASEV